MEDVDEGFASNESNYSNPNKEDLLNDFKYLNGQRVIDSDTNLDKLFRDKVCENGDSMIGENQVNKYDKNGSENELDLIKNKTREEHCDSNTDVGTVSVFEKENTPENTGDEIMEELCKDERESHGLVNENNLPNYKGDTIEGVVNENNLQNHKEGEINGKNLPSNKGENEESLVNENDIPNHKGDTEKMCLDTPETEFQPNISDEQSNKNELVSINGHHVADTKESEEDKNNHDKIDSNGTRSLNMTPVKQQTSSADGERSPFLLDDKVRNSLKGLVAKVKSSEMLREVSSPTGSTVSGDSDGSAACNKAQDYLQKEDDESDKQNNKDTQIENDDTSIVDPDKSILAVSDPDESILADDDEGIPMEIGSENEDDLLELDSENSHVKECNKKETEMALSNESLHANTKSSIALKVPEKEETNSSNPVEILSDNEENAENNFVKQGFEIRHDSVEKIQFEEDSNSNGSSGRINDIVDFLNHDLSGTNSPLTLGDNNKNDDCDSTIDNNSQVEVEGSGMKDKDEIVMEEDCENEKREEETEELMNTEDGAIKEGPTEDSEVKTEDSCSVIKPDEPSLENSQDLGKELNADDKDKLVEKEKIESGKENTHLDVEKQKCNSAQTELVNENDDDDEDDDVIFEGATMPAMRNEFQRRALSGSNVIKPTEDVVKMKNKSKNEYTAKVEDDDDVIFEKVTKAEFSEPKQNCDSVKTKVSANDEKEKTEISEFSPSLEESKNDDTKDNTVKTQDKKCIKKTLLRTSRDSSDRKRSAEDKEVSESKSKRSKLDLTGLIGRLGSRVEPASIEVSDSDEEGGKPLATKTAENEPPAVLAKDEIQKEEDKKLITVTEKELEDLVREKVKLYLTSQRDTLVAKLSQKVKELQQNNDLWKRQVKDLQVKVNDVTVLQQKLEKRKAATAALRQITTRNVAVQVDEGRTMSAHAVLKQMLAMKMSNDSTTSLSTTDANIALFSTASSKMSKVNSVPARVTTQVPFVTSPGGTGTIRLPIPQSSVTPALTTQLTQGSKMVTTTYQTPSVKSLLDTTRIQKTVGSVPSTATSTIGTSVIGLVQYPPTYMAKPTTSQGFVQQTVTQVPTQVSASVAKTVTITSPNASKVIDLTDDDENTKTRLVALQPGINAVTNQQGVRHVIAPAGTQFVRTGLPNQQTYQLVLTSPTSAIRPGMMVTMAPAVTQTTTLIQTVPQTQTLVSPSPAVAPGTTLARAAVPATPITQKAPVSSHPAPFPALPNQQSNGLKALPPKPSLKISRVSQGIVLSWNMSLNDTVAEISNYQLFAYQETSAQPVATLWKKVGDVKALPLPMACTLTQFQVGNKYHFAVRAMDAHNRVGQFSDPGSIHLTPNTPSK